VLTPLPALAIIIPAPDLIPQTASQGFWIGPQAVCDDEVDTRNMHAARWLCNARDRQEEFHAEFSLSELSWLVASEILVEACVGAS
jgi:hypothetical protein